jgi:hypothetical protein
MDSRRDVMGPHTHTSAILENGDNLKYEGPISNVTATIHGFKSHLRIDTCRIFVYSRIAKCECLMILKPRDILVLLKLISIYPHEWAYNTLAVDLGMSPSEVHAAVKRSVKAGLTNHGEFQIQPNISRLEELSCRMSRRLFGLIRKALNVARHFHHCINPDPKQHGKMRFQRC